MEFNQIISVIGVSLIIILTIWIWQKASHRKQTDVKKVTLRQIDQMDGHAFEDYMAVVYAASGFRTWQTKKSRDYGADLVLTDDENETTVIQLKRYRANLGLSSVQEIYAARAYYQASKSVVLTTAESVTDSCWQLAAMTDVHFLVRDDIEEMIKLIKKDKWEDVYWLLATPHIPEKSNRSNQLDKVATDGRKIQVGDYFLK
ncbi:MULTISPECIES: restriction endonuclease [Shouchella]|uniref:Restriction endonuclease n=2 Tax=Shouchella TaxID=2893057 RepID=A0ABY7W5Z3_9BACI|nr:MULTISPECIES: restriction endonuclease [Shouchella]MED4130408.1 restriction endonuclease [Shouchella miscanthi]WDF04294.1 restriction endonuclease [Shouchella hunanensis]GAF21188.1 hypothetical protein JCM19047_862 [Bacillus sp. JCM 19047]